MGNAKFIGRVGALAVALGVGVAATIAPGAALAETDETPSTGASTDRTALIMGGTTIPTPDDYLVELIKNQYIAPTHPGQDIEYLAVTTPQQAGPITGFIRLVGIALGPPSIWGPGGAGWWPDEPWWRLSGLFDLTLEQSVRAGLADLEQAMAQHGNDHLVIYGVSQGSISRPWRSASSTSSTRRGPRRPTSISLCKPPRISPTGACFPASRACTFRSSIGRSAAPRRLTPSSTR